MDQTLYSKPDTAPRNQDLIMPDLLLLANAGRGRNKPISTLDTLNRIVCQVEQIIKQPSDTSYTTDVRSSKQKYIQNARYQEENHSRKMAKLQLLIKQFPILQPIHSATSESPRTIILTARREQKHLRSKQFTPDLGDQEFTQILSNRPYKQQPQSKSLQQHQLSEYTQHISKHSKVKEFSQFILDQITRPARSKKTVKVEVSELLTPSSSRQKAVRPSQLNLMKATFKSTSTNLNDDLPKSKYDLNFDSRNSQRKPFDTKQQARNDIQTLIELRETDKDRYKTQRSSERTSIKLDIPNDVQSGNSSSRVSAYNSKSRDETRNNFQHVAKTIISRIHNPSPFDLIEGRPQIPQLHLFEDLLSKPTIEALRVLKTCRRTVTLKDQSPRVDQQALSMMSNKQNKKTEPLIVFPQLKSPVLPQILRSWQLSALNRDFPSNTQPVSKTRMAKQTISTQISHAYLKQATGPSNVQVVSYHLEENFRGRKIIMQYPTKTNITEQSPRQIGSAAELESPVYHLVSQPLR